MNYSDTYILKTVKKLHLFAEIARVKIGTTPVRLCMALMDTDPFSKVKLFICVRGQFFYCSFPLNSLFQNATECMH
jgi:hypothetical protein